MSALHTWGIVTPDAVHPDPSGRTIAIAHRDAGTGGIVWRRGDDT